MVTMLETLKQVYGGKKIFLTGHTGFKGSWLLKMMHLIGADIKGYALPPETSDDHYCLIDGNRLCNSVYADLRDKQRLINELVSYEPDFVFHLAAQPLVRQSYVVPADTFEINAIGTVNILEGMRQLRKQCFGIFITTDKVYHNNETSYAYQEDDRLGGYDPYSASKACAELVIDSYRNSFFNYNIFAEHGKALAVARAGNVISPIRKTLAACT
jgi:CDP-glucose 4,6-dehydratase